MTATRPVTPGILIVIAAPSGAGKTSLVNALVARRPSLHVSVSHTTRPRRASDVDGQDYHFVAREQFEAMRGEGLFLECARVFGHFYGTSREAVERELAAGHDVILEIDWQGARQIRNDFPEAVSVFILPPSRAALLERLRNRGQDDEQVIAARTRQAADDMRHHDEFDHVVVNDDFDDAVAELEATLDARRAGRRPPTNPVDSLINALLSDDERIE